MAEFAYSITPATDAGGPLRPGSDLVLSESTLSLRALRAAPSVLDTVLPFGHMHSTPTGMSLRHWPDMIWTTEADTPEGMASVDIGHGWTCLHLRGLNALHFLADYLSADPFSEQAQASGSLRTTLGHYDCVLWWVGDQDVSLVVTRSYAQSLVDFLRTLAVRNAQTAPAA